MLKISWMLGYFGFTYSGPILSTIYIEIPSLSLSTLNIFKMHILDNMSKLLYPHGISASSGLGQSYQSRQSFSLAIMSCVNEVNFWFIVVSNSISFQFCSPSHWIGFGVLAGSKLVLPLSRKLKSAISIFFWFISIREDMWNENMSLCFSNRPKQP